MKILVFHIQWLCFPFGLFASDRYTSLPENSMAADTIPAVPDTAVLDIRTSRLDSMINFAHTFIGTPYRYGSTSSKTFDCSGFTAHVFRTVGVELPHGSASQAMLGEKVELKNIQPGDLMFFKGRSTKSKRISHVSLVVEVNGGEIKMIHATSRGVIVDVYQQMDYYTRRFITARRIGF